MEAYKDSNMSRSNAQHSPHAREQSTCCFCTTRHCPTSAPYSGRVLCYRWAFSDAPLSGSSLENMTLYKACIFVSAVFSPHHKEAWHPQVQPHGFLTTIYYYEPHLHYYVLVWMVLWSCSRFASCTKSSTTHTGLLRCGPIQTPVGTMEYENGWLSMFKPFGILTWGPSYALF